MAAKFYKANGELTRYAFACGYLQVFTVDGKPYYSTDAAGVCLYLDGGCWHVKAHNTEHGHAQVWENFLTYKEARQVWGRVRAKLKRGEVLTKPL
jgi:hypothetical protein